jgi:hypothetical protein
MSAIAIKFDAIHYARQLRDVGVSQDQADVQAQTMETILDVAVNTMKEELKQQDLATKKDLLAVELALRKDISSVELKVELKIEALRTELIKWVVTVGVTSCVVLLGGMVTLFQIFSHSI